MNKFYTTIFSLKTSFKTKCLISMYFKQIYCNSGIIFKKIHKFCKDTWIQILNFLILLWNIWLNFITNEGECLFDAISYSLKYLRNSIKTWKIEHVTFTNLVLKSLSHYHCRIPILLLRNQNLNLWRTLHSQNLTLEQASCKNRNLVVDIFYTCFIFLGKHI